MPAPTPDDRDEFSRLQIDRAAAIGADVELQHMAMDTTIAADRHDYSYVWRWLGLPIIQMPTDVVTVQEIVWDHRPQAIVETGVARGGSVIFHASMLQLLGEGRVIAVDIDIRPHNRRAIEEHPLAHRVELIEGSSTDAAVVDDIRRRIDGLERVMVVLDSNHTHEHVLEELRLFAPMVTPDQLLVVADTMVESLPVQEHRPRPWGPGDNPATAVAAFLQETDHFVVDPAVNAKLLMSSNPGGYLRRVV